MPGPGLGAFAHVTIGVAELDVATTYWARNFGLEVTARRDGRDPALGALWGIDGAAIRRQALVATPGAKAGAMHLVEFTNPAPPVRQGAKPYDRLPKNLDLYTRDMPTRFAELEAAGHQFRSKWLEMPGPAGLRFREVHMPGHDEINVVLLEVIGPGYDTPLSRLGYAGIGPLITIVPDCNAESGFYRDVLGMETTLELLLTGPDIERTIGLPPGAGLNLRVYGDLCEPMGRIEVIEYQQVVGVDLYPKARPPATGILHVNYRVEDLRDVRERVRRAGVEVTEHGNVSALYGEGPVVSFGSPAGFRIEVQGRR